MYKLKKSWSAIVATTVASAAIVVLTAGASMALPPAQARVKGSYGFYVSGINARPSPFADLGRFTADGKGNLNGNVTIQKETVPGPSTTGSMTFSGTYAVDSDGSGTMSVPFGDFLFVVDANGDELQMIQDLAASKGVARRQRGPFAAFANGSIPGYLKTVAAQCLGLFTPATAPDFPFGLPATLVGISVNGNGTVDTSGQFTLNGADFPFALTGTISYNADGTFQGDNGGGSLFVGVLTAPGQDYFLMGTHPETVEMCILHQQ